MGLVADHEGLYEAGRLVPAVIVASALLALVVVVARALWTSQAGGSEPAVRSLVAIGFAAAVVGTLAGVMPRQTASGDIICGPVLHVLRDDSEACASVLRPPTVVTAGPMAAAAVAFVAAGVLVRARRRAVDHPVETMPKR